MSRNIALIDGDGRLADYTLVGAPVPDAVRSGSFNRHAIAAAHVVINPTAPGDPSNGSRIDWERTMAYRLRLLDLGMDIAEAMDTAQRGTGLSHGDAMELIERSIDAAGADRKHRIFAGVATDQIDPSSNPTLQEVEKAYRDQIYAVQTAGGRTILMASPSLARVARNADDYIRIYKNILSDADHPVVLHWLGKMFDPRLAGYWGGTDFETACETVLTIVNDAKDHVAGIKLSLLDDAKERALRARLPEGVRLYTGDDFNYPDLIAGDGVHTSDALLGIFDPIAAVASAALDALSRDDRAEYDRLMAPTVPLARTIFRAPTRFYKTGVVFLAWLNGFQNHFTMLGGQQSMRSAPHFCEIFRQADAAGVLVDPDLAAHRVRNLMTIYGVET